MAKAHPIDPFPDHIDRDSFGHWLSGFADGEASFLLILVKDLRKAFAQPAAVFRITLRDDDAAILRLINSYWQCGSIRFYDNARSKIKNAKPIATFGILDTPSLARVIVPHFRRYPMRAKKRRDFEVWAEGVALLDAVRNRKFTNRPGHAPNRHGGTFPKWTTAEREQFRTLFDSLRDQRTYRNDQPPPPVSETPPDREPPTLFDETF